MFSIFSSYTALCRGGPTVGIHVASLVFVIRGAGDRISKHLVGPEQECSNQVQERSQSLKTHELIYRERMQCGEDKIKHCVDEKNIC